MSEVQKLFKDFFHENIYVILGSVLAGILCSAIESIVIPRAVAGTFNAIDDLTKFRNNLFKLILVWISVKLSYSLSVYFKRLLEPEITKYITIKLIKSVFNKYEEENELENVSVLISKIQIIKKNLQEIFYMVFTIFLPRTIVVLFSCYYIFTLNKKIGFIITISILLQIYFVSNGINECVESTFNDLENKDKLYEYIENILYNIDSIESTPNGYENEMKTVIELTVNSKNLEQQSLDCITSRQNRGYVINLILIAVVLFMIYKLFSSGEIKKDNLSIIILGLTGLFDNMYEISYYIPEFTNKLGIIKSNEKFLNNLLKRTDTSDKIQDFEITNTLIEFDNVSFKYSDDYKILDKFSIKIPENIFLGVYGPSGSGKTTLIKMIFGIRKPNLGKIKIDGKDLSKYNLSGIRKYISYINQNQNNLFNKTIYENIIYGYEDSDAMKEKVMYNFNNFKFYDIFKNLDNERKAFSFFNDDVGRLGDKLSGGQKQIIHLLRLDLNDFSKIIILDEVTSALDDKTRNNVVEYINYLKSKGKTIILITHDDYFKPFCNNILQFYNNKNPELL